ncbi:MAG: carbon-nitrogen family hydrolase [Anaerolineales bacterium]|nr:MAG: carbon-nitrogen family hydrolase [Anaerolineales bacterium]
MQLVISLAQMDVTFGDPDANLATVVRMTEEAKRRGSDLILLPELWSTGYDLTRAARYASALTSGLFAELSALARRTGIHIVGSTLSTLGENRFGNTLTVFAPNGNLLADYSKIHLFRLMDEHLYLTAGDEPALVDLPFGHAGLAICYDLRFPELFRGYALAGAAMTFLPSEWPKPRLVHWQTLVRARAIENQMFVFACNRVGSDPSNEFFGHSMAADPWGEILAEGGEGEELITLTADLSKVQETRRKIPILEDRRAESYW